MLRLYIALTITICTVVAASGQNDTMSNTLPFQTIQTYPDTLTPATLLARSIEGLGFRYYWATEGLTTTDMDYTVGNNSRDTRETLEHLLDLAEVIHNVVLGQPNIRPRPRTKKSDYVRRRTTLRFLKAAVDHLRANPDLDLSTRPIIFQRGETVSEVANWHLYNGPLADALWHCGQVVSFRRAAGNPMPEGVNVFMGTKD